MLLNIIFKKISTSMFLRLRWSSPARLHGGVYDE